MYNNYLRLDTAGADYDTITTEQETAYNNVPGHGKYNVRLNLAGTQAIIRVFTETMPTGDTVLETWNSPQAVTEYIGLHNAEWNEPIT